MQGPSAHRTCSSTLTGAEEGYGKEEAELDHAGTLADCYRRKMGWGL